MEQYEENGNGTENASGNGHSHVSDGGDMEPETLENNSVKSLFRIGEVSRVTATKPFVLRYWETEFPMLQPVKSPKGHRLYRQEDIDTVFTIKRLLYNEGFTIAGARRHLRDQALGANGNVDTNGATPSEAATTVHATHSEEPKLQGTSQATPALAANLAVFNRQILLDLRDSLRSLLTALESE